MTAHIGSTSIDGTPISQADLARIDAEERLHVQHQRSAVKIVASSATDAEDCRRLLSILGIDGDVAVAARHELGAGRKAATGKRARKTRAA